MKPKMMTLDQLRTTQAAGGVASVTLEAIANEFAIKVKLKEGGEATLAVKNTGKERTFADPRRALLMLREMGIRKASIDATRWEPGQRSLGGM